MKRKSLILFLFCLHLFNTRGQSIVPVKTISGYSFTVYNVVMEVDPTVGGRISSLKLNDSELMFIDKTTINDNPIDTWGSTFWPSPQNLWNWPPPDALDKNPYSATVKEDALILKSDVFTNQENKFSFQFVKSFTANSSDTSITVVYKIINKGNAPVSVAPWEITRFPGGGITFFPQRVTGEQITGDLKPFIQDLEGISWFNYDSTTIPTSGTQKFFSDGTEGWLAHAQRNGNLIIKSFKDSDPSLKAPAPENEIEHYTANDKSYQEVEQQGPYTSLAVGDSLEWPIKWLVRKVPANVPVVSGNLALADYVRSTIENSITSVKSTTSEQSFVTLYPNPAKSFVHLEFSNSVNSIIMYDAYGRNLQEIRGLSGSLKELSLPIGELSPGLYYVKINTNDRSEIKSFIVE